MSPKKVTTLKRVLHAGRGDPKEFGLNVKAIFNYEVLVPPESDGKSDIFPDERLVISCTLLNVI